MRNIQEEIEDKVIDYINLSALGRLVIVKPEEKKFEDYLFIERKGKYKEPGMYFNVNAMVLPAENTKFIKDFPEESIVPEKNFYLLFVYFDEPKQIINDNVWLIPFTYFRETADIIPSGSGKNILRFESPLDFSENDKYSKFSVNIKNLGELILDAFEKDGNFDFKKMGPHAKQEVNLNSLKEFLCLARGETYASDANPIENMQLLGSKQFVFQKGAYYYRNIFYSGEKKIIGQEIVYQETKPIFATDYECSQIGKIEAGFLKEALSKLSNKCRLNENCAYEKREYKYECKGSGSIDDFSGVEEVFINGKSIYKLTYQGGLL